MNIVHFKILICSELSVYVTLDMTLNFSNSFTIFLHKWVKLQTTVMGYEAIVKTNVFLNVTAFQSVRFVLMC